MCWLDCQRERRETEDGNARVAEGPSEGGFDDLSVVKRWTQRRRGQGRTCVCMGSVGSHGQRKGGHGQRLAASVVGRMMACMATEAKPGDGCASHCGTNGMSAKGSSSHQRALLPCVFATNGSGGLDDSPNDGVQGVGTKAA